MKTYLLTNPSDLFYCCFKKHLECWDLCANVCEKHAHDFFFLFILMKTYVPCVFKQAFGNAKTSENNNSSRFGKFTQLIYLESGVIRGWDVILCFIWWICKTSAAQRKLHRDSCIYFFQQCILLGLFSCQPHQNFRGFVYIHVLFVSCRAVIEKYLLEKSRLVSRDKSERYNKNISTPHSNTPYSHFIFRIGAI